MILSNSKADFLVFFVVSDLRLHNILGCVHHHLVYHVLMFFVKVFGLLHLHVLLDLGLLVNLDDRRRGYCISHTATHESSMTEKTDSESIWYHIHANRTEDVAINGSKTFASSMASSCR